jgi:probable HAF family extracellular repeat protein
MNTWKKLLLGLGFTAIAATSQAVEYSVTDLGMLITNGFGQSSIAKKINNSGTVIVGTANARDFVYQNGKMTPVPWFLFDINNKNQMCGTDFLHAVLIDENLVAHDLGTLGGSVAWAVGINDSGKVVGYSGTSDPTQTNAFLYSNGVMKDIGKLSGSKLSVGMAINKQNKVVGTSFFGSNINRAFLYQNGIMSDLGLPDSMEGVAVNNSNQILGVSSLNVGSYKNSYLISGGTNIFLGAVEAKAINNLGYIVGNTNHTGFISHDGIFWDINKNFTNINPTGIVVSDITDINDKGQMSATGTISGSSTTHALLINPVTAAYIKTFLNTSEFIFPSGIDGSGRITGFTGSGDPNENAISYILENGTFTDIGSLGGDATHARAINGGRVVGSSKTLSGEIHAFLYSRGQMKDLGTLGGNLSEANDINSLGQIVGYSTLANGQTNAFLYSGTNMISLGTFLPGGVGESVANGINKLGSVVGYSIIANGSRHAFLYSGGVMAPIRNLSTESWSSAVGINNSGEISGSFSPGFGAGDHAFLYSGGSNIDLGTFGGRNSHAYKINNTGNVVGAADDANGVSHAFIYKNKQMKDLNSFHGVSSSTNLIISFGINDKGQIIGYGSGGGTYLLTPDTNFVGTNLFPTIPPGTNFVGTNLFPTVP